MNEVYLYGEVGRDFTARELIEVERGSQVHINSGGGNVFEGLAICNVLKKAGAEIVIDGLCASAASIIACAGKVTMAENGVFMVHLPTAGLEGYFNSSELAGVQKSLEMIKAAIITTYQAKTGLSESELTRLMESESWLSAEQAKALGFVDEILSAGGDYKMEVTDKLKASVLVAERGRIKALNALKSGVVEIDALIETAIERGAEVEEVKPYIAAIEAARANKPDNGLEELKALIRDNLSSGAANVGASIPAVDKKQAQADLITKYANEIGGRK